LNCSPELKKDWPGWQVINQHKGFLDQLSLEEVEALYWHWPFWARPDQLPPESDWTSWLMLGGRGAGKTRAGAEWVRTQVERQKSDGGCRFIALVGETYGAAREVMIEGPSGLLAISPPSFRPVFKPSRNLLIWPNGAQAQLFSAERPESLRGPQFDAAWCDELGKWRYDEATWDMLQFGLRLGKNPRQVVTTTPRPTRLIKRLLADNKCYVSRAATEDNRANLAPGFIENIVGRYQGTHLGRQELGGEMIDEISNALWSRGLLDRQRCQAVPAFGTVLVALDPPASSGPKADACGIIVLARGADEHAYVLDDRTVQGLGPTGWARRVVAAYRDHQADFLVGEVNQGGELVRDIVLHEAPDIVFRPVRAVKGKMLRAEPVAALYERGRVFHYGVFGKPMKRRRLSLMARRGSHRGRRPVSG
jgi:phage terminase large subunit-like protein